MAHQCPFCTKTEEDYILETAHFAVIYNISPILPGHMLVIPKQHYESIFALTEAQYAEFMLLSRTAAKFVGEVFDTEAFDWAIQEKEAAGQSVAHLHLHVVPRSVGDLRSPGAWYQEIEKSENIADIDTYERFQLTQAQLDELTKRLKEEAERRGYGG